MTEPSRTVLIVDDQPENLAVLAGILQPHYQVRAVRSGELALRAAATPPRPDLALLDIMMPGMDGFTLLTKLRESPECADIPVIFVTALGDDEDEQRGLELGAVDYITKPIKPAIVLARVHTHIELKDSRDRLSRQNASLEAEVAKRTDALDKALKEVEAAHAKLKKTYFVTLTTLNDLAGLRAAPVAEHSARVAALSRQVAFDLGLGRGGAQDVFIAALLHDIGKVGLPDSLLRKSVAAMTRDEVDAYRQHPVTGAKLLGKIEALADIAAIVGSHHELYNGTGFPKQLSGLDIPIGARIIAAVSDYEDLKSGLLARQHWSAKRSGQYLVECAGSRYDPRVVEALEPHIAGEGKYEIDEVRINVKHLQEGMVLTREIQDFAGFSLLPGGSLLSRHLIDQLAGVERRLGRPLFAYVDRESVRLEEGTSKEEVPLDEASTGKGAADPSS
jgi:putative two-component system response regulator